MSTTPIANAQGTSLEATGETNGEQETPEIQENDGSKCACEDYGLTDPAENDEPLQQAILALVKHYEGLDKYAVRTETIDARRQRFYRRGDQYVVCLESNGFIFTPYGGAGDESNGAPDGDSSRYTDVYNIFWPYMRALISIGVQNPPGVDFEPDDPTVSTDISASRAAETFRFAIDRVNKRKKLQADAMSLFCTDTRCVIYTRNVRDGQKFGFENDGPNKGQPKTVQLMSAHGTLETKPTPITTDKMEEWIYFPIDDELALNLAKETYPKYAANIRQGNSGAGESSYRRMARIGVLQGTRALNNAGDAFAHLVTRKRVWMRPAAFRHAPADIEKRLRELYPSGMKVVVVGDAYCGSCDQAMDDHLSVGWPGPGDGASKPSMMHDFVPVQDAFNDYRNLEKEYADFGIPTVYQLKELFDGEAMRDQTAEPGNHVEVVLPGGLGTIADAFYVEPAPGCPIQIQQAYENLMGALGQFMTGAQPALFGGSDADNTTKGGIAMMRDQAMGQFSICWGGVQELFATAYRQGALCRAAASAKDTDEKIHVKIPAKRGKSMVATIAVADLQKGNFHTYPDLDSSFPETTGSKRQTVSSIVTQALTNPEATEAYGVLEPENLEIQRELLGVHDWVIPGAESGDKQMMEIELLLKSRPTPNVDAIKAYAADQAIEGAVAEQAEGTGIPVPKTPPPNAMQMYQSSIPVDPMWDRHNYEIAKIEQFLSSSDGIEEAKSNKWGILNVKLHGMEHKAAKAAQAPPPGAIPPMPPKKGVHVAPPIPTPGPMNSPAPAAPTLQ
jgi:hypothetical protein